MEYSIESLFENFKSCDNSQIDLTFTMLKAFPQKDVNAYAKKFYGIILPKSIGTDFEKIGWRKLPYIRKLNLSGMGLKTIPTHIKNIPFLEDLDLSFNEIEMKDQIFLGLYNLKSLNLFGNEITKLSKNCFDGLENLKHLDLCGNNIADFSLEFFTNLKSLQELEITNREIKTPNFTISIY